MPMYEVIFSGQIEVEADDEEMAEILAKDMLELYVVIDEVNQIDG